MNYSIVAIAVVFTVSLPNSVVGHGTLPIVVGVENGTLTVTGGLTPGGGYAANVFADPDDEALLEPLPNNGDLLFTGLPAFKLSGMSIGSGLFLEALSRRQVGEPSTPRWLWYWNPATEAVESEPHDPLAEVITNFDGEISITQFGTPASASVPLATPTSTELGSHADLMRLLLSNAPAPNDGVYGFFARVTSPSYSPSAPFFIAMSLGVSDSLQFQQGAAAINAAAGLAGDFDFSGQVEGADFLAWQRALGASAGRAAVDADLDGTVGAADLAIWQSQFGQPAQTSTVVSIAEPTAAELAAILLAALFRQQRKAPVAPRPLRTGSRG